MTEAIFSQLTTSLPGITKNESLAKHCTIRVGGPAAAFLVTRSTNDLITAIKTARQLSIPFHILGGGSNTLFADTGFDGLVIKHMANQVVIGDKTEALEPANWSQPTSEIRHEAADPAKYISFGDLDFEERPGDTLVTADSGVNLTAFIVKTLDAGLTGLQWYGAIPGAIGGAVYNNIHGGTHFIAERVKSVTVLTPDNQQLTLPKSELAFGYDTSRFHTSGEIILTIDWLLTKGTIPEVERAELAFREWGKRKTIMQPKHGSMGSTFQNVAQAVRQQVGAPTTAAGWFIDQCGLKGKIIGGAQIAPEHANFIVNTGGATAADVKALMDLAQRSVKQKFGIDLTPEVFLIGNFDH